MNTYDATFEDELEDRSISVRFHYEYTRGRPAYTPRGEYAPIDPPEPSEVNVTHLEVRGVVDGKLVWRKPTTAENTLLMAWYQSNPDLELAMSEEAERWYYEGPDPDAAYDEMREREWDK